MMENDQDQIVQGDISAADTKKENILLSPIPGDRRLPWYVISPFVQAGLVGVGILFASASAGSGSPFLLVKIAISLSCFLAIFPIITLFRSKFVFRNLVFVLINLVVPAFILYLYFNY